jgi:flagellar FliJ protein
VRRFRFSLEKVLRLRSQETEQAKRALGQAVTAEEAVRQAMEAAQALLRMRTDQAVARERLGFSAFEFSTLRTHLAYLNRCAGEAEEALARARAITQQRRLELLRARRQERVLEKLREHRLQQYNLEALREEQKEFDEYGSRQSLNSPSPEPDI